MARRFGFIIVILTMFLGAAPATAQSGNVSGVWLTQAGDARVRVGKCGGGNSARHATSLHSSTPSNAATPGWI